jgi:nucleotide-binding universal stress UspA family protein
MKDLLVYVDQSSATPIRLDVVFALAERFGAHVTALSLIAEPFVRSSILHHVPPEVIREHLAHAAAEAEVIVTTARETAARRGLSFEHRRDTGSLDRLPSLLAGHARHADLAIVGQPNLKEGGVDDALLAEAAFMDSGRPALVVPYEGAPTFPPRCALIAWDGSREAARAANDAIPLLKLTQRAVILIIDARDVAGRAGDHPGADIATHLARHGINAEVSEVQSGGASAGEIILAQAREQDAGLTIMGGYGHSRLREMMLGGATRHVLEQMTIPALFSH